MDWSEKNLCIKCNKDGSLLVCCESDCPLAIHEGCMGCPARFDEKGDFYCPYCLYKRAVTESRRAREYALARKNALLTFMDEGAIGSYNKRPEVNDGAEANGHNQSKVSDANLNVTTCGDDKTRRDSDSISDRQPTRLDEEHKISDTEKGNIQEDEIEASAGSKGREEHSFQTPEQQKIVNEEETRIRDEGREAGSEELSLEIRKGEISSASSGLDSLPLSERARRASKRRKITRENVEAVSVRSKSVVEQSDKDKRTSPIVNSPRRSSRRASLGTGEEVIKEKVEISKKLKREVPPVKLAHDAFSSGKRKRLLWREEEEEMLKAGVEKYSKEPIKNLPWRKILEMGRRVFDGTRTPGDLKDKWRNISSK